MDPFYQPPVAQKQPFFSHRMLLIGIGLLLAIILAIIMMVLSNRHPLAHDFGLAVAREQTLYNLADKADNDITSPDLAKITTDAKTFFISDTTTLSSRLAGFGLKDIPKSIAALESTDDFVSQLESAKQNNNFDKTYQQLLNEKIDTQSALLKKIYQKISNTETKQAISLAYANLQALQKQLQKISL